MTEEIIDINAQEVVESSEEKSQPPVVRINDKELAKVFKQYKRYRKSSLAEIRRLDGAPQYDFPI